MPVSRAGESATDAAADRPRPATARRYPPTRLAAALAVGGLTTALLTGCTGLGATSTSTASPPAARTSTQAPATSSATGTATARRSEPTAARTRSATSSASPTRPPGPEPSVSASAPRSTTRLAKSLRPGSSGPKVVALQQRLTDLGYWVSSSNGRYGLSTSQAVMALQKAAGLSRDGVAGPKTMAALAAGKRPRARSERGHVIEIDKKQQLVKIVDDGQIRYILNTSTGSGETYRNKEGQLRIAVTPAGSFRVERQIQGWHTAPLGRLYSPKFFNGGIALHGSESIPGFAASHGCARISVPAMDFIWDNDLMPRGTRVLVY